MDPDARDELERRIRRSSEQADFAAAATEAMRGYGPEIFGLLFALHRSEQDAADVFSIFTEDLWRGLPGFAWECSFRTWAYTLARNASRRFGKNARRRKGHEVPLSALPALSAIEEAVRTETLPHLRSEAKSEMAILRQTLSHEDQTLLILRLDKALSWNDLARVMLGEGELPTEEALAREAA